MKLTQLLLVDDDEAHRYLLRRLLARSGFVENILELDSLERTREFFRETEESLAPQILIMDLNLRDGRSTSILKYLREEKRYSQMPIVILSTSSLEMDMRECLELGASDYLVKSEDFSELEKQLCDCVKKIIERMSSTA